MGFFSNLFGNSNAKAELATVLQKGAFLVDVRSAAEYAAGHVKGSVNIPVEQVQQQLLQFKNKEHIIVFCRSGNRSGMAKSILNQNGFKNVSNGGTWNNINNLLSKQ